MTSSDDDIPEPRAKPRPTKLFMEGQEPRSHDTQFSGVKPRMSRVTQPRDIEFSGMGARKAKSKTARLARSRAMFRVGYGWIALEPVCGYVPPPLGTAPSHT